MMSNFEDEEKWLKHYASSHQILLIGDGDFSFSLCLANTFGSASNIVATSLDTYDAVIIKYKKAKTNVHELKELGAQVLHGVDAIRMSVHTDLRMRKFDRVIFNFPHAGFYVKEDHPRVIKKHRDLLHGFFKSASKMLRPDGEVHVNHKTSGPCSHWNIGELAFKNCLVLIGRDDFKIADYPGYNNKRGDSARCDEPFPLGKASTYKFIFSTNKKMGKTNPLTSISPNNIQHQLVSLDANYTSRPSEFASGNHRLAIPTRIRSDWYLDHAATSFWRSNYAEAHYVCEGLRHGSVNFMAEHLGIQPQPIRLNPNFAARPSDVASGNHILPVNNRIRNDWYFNHPVTTFERPNCEKANFVGESLRGGSDKFIPEYPTIQPQLICSNPYFASRPSDISSGTTFGIPNFDKANFVCEASRRGSDKFMAENSSSQPHPIGLNPYFASRHSDISSGNHIPIHDRNINGLYFDHSVTTFGGPNCDGSHYVCEGWRRGGSDKFIPEYPSIQPRPICLNSYVSSRSSDVASGNPRLPIYDKSRNDWYIDHSVTTFGRLNCNESHYVGEGLLGATKFMAVHHNMQPQPSFESNFYIKA